MSKSNYIKILPTYFLFIFFPSLFGLLLYYFVLKIDKNHKIEKMKLELSERATDFMVTATPVEYFQPYFKKFSENLLPFTQNSIASDGSFTAKDIVSKEIKDFETKLGDLNIRFVCALFDENAKLLNPNNLKDNEIRFFTYVWNSIHVIPNSDYKNREVDQTQIIGNEFRFGLMIGQKEYTMPTYSSGRTGILYINNAYDPNDSGFINNFTSKINKTNSKEDKNNDSLKENKNYRGILIYINHKRNLTELVQAKIKDYATYEQPIILYDSQNKLRKTSTLGHNEIQFDRTNTEEFLDGFIENNVLWLGLNSDEYKLLFGQIINNPNYYRNKLLFAVIIFIIGLLIITLLFYRNFINEKGIYISIRYKLIFIFALAIYMPTLSLWVLSYTSLHDHRTAIENKIKKGIIDILNQIDTDYKKTEEKIFQRYLELDIFFKSFKGRKPPRERDIFEELARISGDKNFIYQNFNWLDIRNIHLKQIYTSYTSEVNERLEKFARVISLLCLDRYCPQRLSNAGIKPNQSDIFVGNLLENPIVGFAFIFERPNQLNYLNFDGVGVYWWWNYYSESDNPIAFCIGTTPIKYAVLNYFKSLLKERYTLGNTNLKVINFRYYYQEFIPNIKSNRKELIDLINVSNLNKTVESTTINQNNNKYLCICKPGNNLKDCYSLCMYPISEIDYQIEKVRSTIYSVMILLLLISVFTGLLLAKTFITPVKELSRGVIALRNRDTNTILKIENKDELGHLGQAFNQMMSDIKDMLLAGAVQQCLIPTGKYKMEGYDCVVYNQMATDVGGDYADIFELPNDRVLIVIGDVTGHGVSSSLLTAMVKASVYRFANKNTTLNEIVTQTSNMIADLLNKKKLMTFCAVILDKNTGELSICNAGHPFPIIREKEIGSIRMPNKSSFPMGISSKRAKYCSESELLRPEETLFLYTDGFPEAENNKGKIYGYKEFQQLIANSDITSSEELKEYLLKVFREFHGETELADDITFIILRRNPL